MSHRADRLHMVFVRQVHVACTDKLWKTFERGNDQVLHRVQATAARAKVGKRAVSKPLTLVEQRRPLYRLVVLPIGLAVNEKQL